MARYAIPMSTPTSISPTAVRMRQKICLSITREPGPDNERSKGKGYPEPDDKKLTLKKT